MYCNHSWSRLRRITLHSKAWIDIEKCRRLCQQRQQIKYQLVLIKGVEKVLANKLPINVSEPDSMDGERISNAIDQFDNDSDDQVLTSE